MSSRRRPGLAPRVVAGLQEAKAEVRAAGPFVPARSSPPRGPNRAPTLSEAARQDLLDAIEVIRNRITYTREPPSDEDLSDDELDEMVRERQEENVEEGRPRGGFSQVRQQILAERQQDRTRSKEWFAVQRRLLREAEENLQAFDEGRFAVPVEPPPNGIATPIRPEPYERMSAEERNEMLAAGATEEEIEREERRRLLRYLQAERDYTEETGPTRATARRTGPPAAPRSPGASTVPTPKPRAERKSLV